MVIISQNRDYLEVNEIEAKVIRLIFDLFVKERLTLREIGRRLNDLNIPTPGLKTGRTSAKGWVQPTISRLLKSETFVGRWYFGRRNREKVNGQYRTIKTPKSEWIMVNVPAIIDEATFSQAQILLTENKRKAKRNRVHNYLLGGHIICGMCGYRAIGKYAINPKRQKYFYYSCPCRNDRELRNVSCNLPFFPKAKVDVIVWQWMKKLLKDPDSLKDGLGNYEKERAKELEPMLRRLKTINELIVKSRQKWDRLIDAYIDGVIDKETVESRKSELEVAINGLEEEKANLESLIEANTISDEHIAYLKKLAENHALRGLELADNHYETQRELVEVLNVEVRMTVEDGKKVIYVSCAFDKDRFTVDNGTIWL